MPSPPPQSRTRALLDDDGAVQDHPSPLLLNSTAAPHTPGSPRRRPATQPPPIHPALRGYLTGQLSAACTFGIWWVLSSPIFIAIFDKYGVGLMRLCYNAALFLCSPIAGILVEKTRIRSVLCSTTLTRALIYSVALPSVWLLLRSPLLPLEAWPGSETALQAIVLVLVFVDGVAVSLANVAAIDCGGSDLVAQEAGAHIDDAVRNVFNTRHQAVFDGSMLVLSPALAFGTYFAGKSWRAGAADAPPPSPPSQLGFGDADDGGDTAGASPSSSLPPLLLGGSGTGSGSGGHRQQQLVANDDDAQTLVLIGALGAAFFVLSAISLGCYLAKLPSKRALVLPGGGGGGGMGGGGDGASGGDALPPQRLRAVLCEALRSLPADARLVWRHRPVFWRIVFLGLETALEDAMVALVIPELCLHGLSAQHDDLTIGSLQAAVAIAVGKLGAVVAAGIMSCVGPAHAAEGEGEGGGGAMQAPRWLFNVACLGGLSALGAPLVLDAMDHSASAASAASLTAADDAPPPSLGDALLSAPLGVLCAVSFCFFLLTTLPKIGFATLLQSLAAQADASGRVFGFVASFVTMCDAAVMMGLSLLFGTLSLRAALWAACGCFAFVGVLEGTLGRYLVSERPGRVLRAANDASYVPYQGA